MVIRNVSHAERFFFCRAVSLIGDLSRLSKRVTVESVPPADKNLPCIPIFVESRLCRKCRAVAVAAFKRCRRVIKIPTDRTVRASYKPRGLQSVRLALHCLTSTIIALNARRLSILLALVRSHPNDRAIRRWTSYESNYYYYIIIR